MGFSIVLLMTVWLTGAMLVGLLCLTSILAGAAAAGNIGLGFAVRQVLELIGGYPKAARKAAEIVQDSPLQSQQA